MNQDGKPVQALAASITKSASKQTNFTIKHLVDRELTGQAYLAYAYFRWLDDRLDQGGMERSEQVEIVDRQKILIDRCYQGEIPPDLSPEERMVVELIRNDRGENTGLQTYIQNMMAVMDFDADRRGRLISQEELAGYTHALSSAVTEAMFYFIGHNCPSPRTGARYLAVTGAHIAHMLRDTFDDIQSGYYNIPREVLESHGISPEDVSSDPYRDWVRDRVRMASAYFRSGKSFLARVENLRCRLAGYAYISRFEWLLETIRREGYLIRPEYRERKNTRIFLKMSWQTLSQMVAPRQGGSMKLGDLPVREIQ